MKTQIRPEFYRSQSRRRMLKSSLLPRCRRRRNSPSSPEALIEHVGVVMDLELKQHSTLVIGGASGIGLAAARMFAREGSHVDLWDHSPNVESIAAEIGREFQVRAAGRR